MRTLSWLKTNSSCHSDDSILYKQKIKIKKLSRHNPCIKSYVQHQQYANLLLKPKPTKDEKPGRNTNKLASKQPNNSTKNRLS